ncbi:ABC transporter ATP-binding protein [Halodesulfovibrio sp.]|jgi:branched-chain amino acid transport system ATP-binding protein|uniref:ABC transporter ATP-binding protein n=1 Tax=Halodesulfovibrio sp. TaxID=1912772 RepID=UPI0025FB5A96|nr:ABC transporter ATP-binding protein [Halodesulfovibrio sp.]MCT4625986.1 ABC transporter ATP-binding protein [Halodesulfovibrio sp.]
MSLIELKNLTKSFGGLLAVNDVSFSVEEGTIVGLIGPNGAGKTTVFNLITGNYVPDTGEAVFNGKDVVGMQTHRIVNLGIARTFQTIRLFKSLSALENVLSGCHCRMKSGIFASMFRTPAQRVEEKHVLEKAMAELEFVGLKDQWDTQADSLSYGKQRLLEIARALATEPKFIILDEPAGGMNDQETQELIDLIKAIRDRGITVLLIEHDMSLVMKICEHLVVLEYGAVIAEGDPETIKNDPRVIEAYLGADDDLL